MNGSEIFTQFDTTYSGIRCLNRLLIPTTWNLSFQLMFNVDKSGEDLDKNLKKVNFYIDYVLENSVIFDHTNEWAKETFLYEYVPDQSNNVVLTPYMPDDAHIAALLLSKFNSLCGEFINFESLKINSTFNQGISYVFVGNGTDALPGRDQWLDGKFNNLKPWWERNDSTSWDILAGYNIPVYHQPQFEDLFKDQKKENRVDGDTSANIIVANFKKSATTSSTCNDSKTK